MGFCYKTMLKIVSLIAGVCGLFMALPLLCAIYTGDSETAMIFAAVGVICAVCGFLGYHFIPRSEHPLHSRDAYLIVFCAWLVCAIVGAIPYYMSNELSSICDAIFESVAGFSTTGVSAVAQVTFSDPFILWKALTHWLGAMGILIFVITILPTMGPGGQRIVAAESPGAGLSSTAPRSRDLAKLLYLIYSSLTLIEFLLLWLGSSMEPFEALINSLGSISTAGLTLHPGGVAHYGSLYVEAILSIFTIFASCNFLLFIYLIKRHFDDIRRNVEVRVFFAIILIATILITADLTSNEIYTNAGEAFRHAFFQVTSFMTTSGFSTADYTVWPTFCRMLLFTLLFIGGCVASTSGSIKVLRIITMFKLIKRGFFKKLHPRSMKSIKIGENVLTPAMVSSVTSFVALYVGTFLVGSIVLSLEGFDIETTMSSVAALLSTTGSSFGEIGPNGNYAAYGHGAKLFMSLLMLVGRLEVYTIFIMFFPSFWDPSRGRTN